MTAAAGIHVLPRQPLLHYAARQDVVIWSPTRLDSTPGHDRPRRVRTG